ncbi:MAG TPA: efflux RND transporter periplasmic adaptor subunit [bacterium]|nr:efflux RND transporter periplasmic adaptor subunit [bacterium]
MKHKKLMTGALTVLVALGIVAGHLYMRKMSGKAATDIYAEIAPAYRNIQVLITTTGKVDPQNRLEIKPPISGRIDEILVKEGDMVKVGDTLAWMSSTERAALVDAASSRDKKESNYWKDVYKPAPLIAPIEGEVIVRAVEPGQTVMTSDPVLVLSDRLIVKAQFDEVDIGKVKVGQTASISLDAYPDKPIKGKVDHIAYESVIVNNVTMYEVDILPDERPDFMRSGMSANISVIAKSKEHVLTVPDEAITREGGKHYVTVSRGLKKQGERREIEIGISEDKSTEIVSGLSPEDKILVKEKLKVLPKSQSSGKNPFMPERRKKKDQ